MTVLLCFWQFFLFFHYFNLVNQFITTNSHCNVYFLRTSHRKAMDSQTQNSSSFSLLDFLRSSRQVAMHSISPGSPPLPHGRGSPLVVHGDAIITELHERCQVYKGYVRKVLLATPHFVFSTELSGPCEACSG